MAYVDEYYAYYASVADGIASVGFGSYAIIT